MILVYFDETSESEFSVTGQVHLVISKNDIKQQNYTV